MEAMLIVLFPEFKGELNSIIIGVVYLSFTNFISVAYLIMRSRVLVLYGLDLVRKSVRKLIFSSSECSSDGYMVWSSCVGIFAKLTKCLSPSQLVYELRLVISNDLVIERS